MGNSQSNNFKIYLKNSTHDLVGFNKENNHMLSISANSNSNLDDLIDQFNKYRGPDSQVKHMNSQKNITENMVIMVFPKNN